MRRDDSIRGLDLIQSIKDGYFTYVYQIINRIENKNTVEKLAEGMIYFYKKNPDWNNAVKALQIFESLDVEELRSIDEQLVKDLYVYISLSYEKLGLRHDAKRWMKLREDMDREDKAKALEVKKDTKK